MKEKNYSLNDFQKMIFAFYTCIKNKHYDIAKYKEELKIIEEIRKKINSTIADDDQLLCEHFDELNLYYMKIINNLTLSNDDKMSFKDTFTIKEFDQLSI
jgi:hypothetical protein